MYSTRQILTYIKHLYKHLHAVSCGTYCNLFHKENNKTRIYY